MMRAASARTIASAALLGAARCVHTVGRVLIGARHGASGVGLATTVIASVLAILAVTIGVENDFASRIPPLSGADAILYDVSAGVIAATRREAPWPATAVVLVDRQTLASAGWSSVPRALQQPQLGALGRELLEIGARRIGYDLVFAFDPADLKPPLSAPSDYDSPLTDLLAARSDDIVLGADASVPPASRYADLVGPAQLGVIDLQTESDGRIRSVANRIRLSDGARRFGFAAALARDPDAPALLAGRTLILPQGRLGSITHLSAAAFEACLATSRGRDDLERLLRGRTVVIGSGLDGEDEHAGPDRFLPRTGPASSDTSACDGRVETAVGRGAGRVPGAFLQAAAVEGLLSRDPIALAPIAVRVAVDLAIAVVALAIMRLVNGAARLPALRSRMLGTTLRAAAVLVASLALLAAIAVGADVLGLVILRLWIPIGTMVVVASLLCVVQTMAVALKRDLALADLKLAFGRWLPSHVIDATLDASHTVLHGSERPITVLMADLNNFTPYCAAHRDRPESIVRTLNDKFSIAQAAIDRHGGCLDKFDGDAVIAFWNGLQPQADHASRAVAAAIDLVKADREDVGAELSFKCAVATGVAFVGRYGSEQKSSFSALGEPMNLAARLEKLCRPHSIDIVISGATVDAMRDVPGIVPAGRAVLVGQAELKGFDQPVTFYTIAG